MNAKPQTTIREIPRESFTLDSINPLRNQPHLKADLIDRGFFPHIYTLARVTEGTRKRPYKVLALRNAATHEFQTLL